MLLDFQIRHTRDILTFSCTRLVILTNTGLPPNYSDNSFPYSHAGRIRSAFMCSAHCVMGMEPGHERSNDIFILTPKSFSHGSPSQQWWYVQGCIEIYVGNNEAYWTIYWTPASPSMIVQIDSTFIGCKKNVLGNPFLEYVWKTWSTQ